MPPFFIARSAPVNVRLCVSLGLKHTCGKSGRRAERGLDWWAPIDIYCERTGAGFWSEPFNALSNAAFLVAALWSFRLARRTGADDAVKALAALVFAIGIGSFAFHSFAVRWAALADVIPIATFIYAYFGLALRRFLGLGWLRRDCC